MRWQAGGHPSVGVTRAVASAVLSLHVVGASRKRAVCPTCQKFVQGQVTMSVRTDGRPGNAKRPSRSLIKGSDEYAVPIVIDQLYIV